MSWLGWGPATNPQYEELVGESQSRARPLELWSPPLLSRPRRLMANMQLMIPREILLPSQSTLSSIRRYCYRPGGYGSDQVQDGTAQTRYAELEA